MRACIGTAMGPYWGNVVQAMDVIATISALGAVGGLPALVTAVTHYARRALRDKE
ncbi:MAG TPA: hypothetical protein VK523_06890 [Steroidobacteraceae bacterium]|nr:hypothetical protein [Steroidobacteraceae bacterium]